jgi:hypothetical protein
MNIRKWIPFLLLELIAFLHLMRILLGVDVVIDGDAVPMYVSVSAIVLFGLAGWLVLTDAPPSESGP